MPVCSCKQFFEEKNIYTHTVQHKHIMCFFRQIHMETDVQKTVVLGSVRYEETVQCFTLKV